MSGEEFVVKPGSAKENKRRTYRWLENIRKVLFDKAVGERVELPDLTFITSGYGINEGDILGKILGAFGLAMPAMISVHGRTESEVKTMLESGYRIFKATFFIAGGDLVAAPGMEEEELPFYRQLADAGLTFAFVSDTGWRDFESPSFQEELHPLLEPVRRYVAARPDGAKRVLAEVYVYRPTGRKVVFLPDIEHPHMVEPVSVARTIASFLFIIIPVLRAEGLLHLIRRVDGVASEAAQAASATLPALARLRGEILALRRELEAYKRDRPRLAILEAAEAVPKALPEWRFIRQGDGFTLKYLKTIYPKYVIINYKKYRIKAKGLFVKGLSIHYAPSSDVFEVRAEDALHANISAGGEVCLGDLSDYSEATTANLIVLVHRLPKLLETCNLDSPYTSLKRDVHFEVLGEVKDEFDAEDEEEDEW